MLGFVLSWFCRFLLSIDGRLTIKTGKRSEKQEVRTHPPFILKTSLYAYTREFGLLDLYSKKTIYLIFSRKNSNFCRLFRVSSRLTTLILSTPFQLSCVRGFWVACCRVVGQSRTFDSHISQLKEPFYLTGDKSARLALIEPHIKRKPHTDIWLWSNTTEM